LHVDKGGPRDLLFASLTAALLPQAVAILQHRIVGVLPQAVSCAFTVASGAFSPALWVDFA
jgi:hypothetical protein